MRCAPWLSTPAHTLAFTVAGTQARENLKVAWTAAKKIKAIEHELDAGDIGEDVASTKITSIKDGLTQSQNSVLGALLPSVRVC